jgi:hypothetical protein
MSNILKPVIAQLEAYNNQDIEKFIVNFSENCVVEDGEGNVILTGRTAMFESYKKMFEASPKLYCHLANRTVIGNYVLDEERVTGRNGNPEESHVVAVYRIENEEIVHVRFLR